MCQKHARECRFTGCDARSDGKYCKEHGCVHAGCGGQRLLVGQKFDDGSKYCKRHKCVHCCRKAVWRGRLRRRGYCRTHTCHTDFCGAGTMSKGARSCKRHKCAYCNSAVIGYRGGFHNRHCKRHSNGRQKKGDWRRKKTRDAWPGRSKNSTAWNGRTVGIDAPANPVQATMQDGVACRRPVKRIRKVRDGTCAKPAVRRAATPAGAAAKKFIRMSFACMAWET